MKKRILTVLLAVCLVFALGTVSALADLSADCAGGDNCNHEAAIGTTHYDTLSEAIAAANNSTETTVTVTLLKNVSVTLQSNSNTTGAYTITRSGVTIDGGSNSYKITATAGTASGSNYQHIFIIQANNVTISNLEIDGSDIARSGIQAYGNVEKLTLSNVTSSNNYGYGVLVNNGASVIANNLDAHENGWGGVNVEAQNTESKFTMNGGNLTNNGAENVISVVLDSDQGGTNTVVLNGGTYNTVMTNIPDGSTPRSEGTNKITISDANVTTLSLNGSGTDKVTVDDGSTIGTISSTNSNNTKPVVTVNDSTVTNPINIKNDITFIANNSYVGGQHQNDAEAKIGDTYYTTLQDALDAATKDQTVVLLKNINADLSTVTSNGAVYVIKTGITFDGNGKKIIAINNKQENVSVQVIGVENVTDAVKITDLVIDGSDEATAGIQAYRSSNVTLDNVVITDCDGAGVIVNAATVTAVDFDTSGNGWGGVNVDNRNYASATFTLKSGNVQSIYTEGTSTTHSSNIVVENGTVGSVFNHVNGSGDNNITIKNGNIGSVSDLSTGKTADISVQGGTFTTAVASSYVDTDYVAYNRTTGYTYTDSLSTAMNAAGQNGTVDYVAGNGWDVTLYYDKDVQTKIEVPDDYVLTLPGGTFEGKQIEGWKYGSEVFEPGDRDTITSDRTYYVILRNGQYNIVIDNDIKHGDVSTDVSSADKGATVYIYVDPDIGYVLDDLEVYYGSRNQYSVNVKFVRTGVYSFIMPGNDVYITATFRYESLPFTDVNRGQWFYDEVAYVYTNGMMEGDSATTFNHDGRMTRAMLWAVLGRIDGANITGNDWAEEARAWAMREGVSDGTNPNDYVTREQMVTMLWRYAGEKNGSASLIRYTDADKISSYAVEAMRWAIGNGIIEGMTSTTLEPQGTATRAQCAAIFMRFDQM